MNGTRFLAVAGLACLAAAALTLSLPAAPAAAPAAPRAKAAAIAVVDIQDALRKLDENAEIRADLNKMAEKMQQERNDREKEVKDLQGKLGVVAQDTPAFAKIVEELEQKTIAFNVWQDYQNRKLARESSLQYQRVYRKLVESIGRLALSSGFNMVLYKEAPLEQAFAGAKPEVVPAVAANRKVIWCVDELDLTAQVIQTMNNEYKNAARTGTAPK